jgi:type II secretion system protein G
MNATVLSLVLATVFAPPAKTSAERSTRIYVRTTPPGASIVLDGKELGTSDGLFLVPPGVRKITLEMDGYHPEGRPIDVKDGWITRVEVRMVKKGAASEAAMLSQARQQLLEYKDELSEKLNHYGEQHPEIVSLRSHIQTTQNRIELLGVQTSTPPHLDSPAAVVERFLEAIRVGDDEKAASLFTPAARAQLAQLGHQVAPKASDTATFDVVKVTSTDDHATVVATWTDHDRTDRMAWLVRSGDEGWRISGMEATVFPGEPPVLLDFEKNLEESMEKIRELQKAKEAAVKELDARFEDEFELAVRAGQGKLTDQEEESLKQQNHPLLGQLADPNTSKLIRFFAKLPDEIHEQLKKEGHVKWRFPDLSEQNQKVVREIIRLNIDMARQQGTSQPGLSLEALQDSQVGFAVVAMENASQKVVSWFVLFPEFPNPIWVTVVNAKAAGTPPYFQAHLRNLPLLREKPEKEQADVESEVSDAVTPHVTTPALGGFDTETRAKIQEAKAQMAVMATAMETYRLDTGEPLPDGFDALVRCTEDVANPERWNGPYLKAPGGTIPLDPWGNEYKVLDVGEGKHVHRGVWSYGPDGKPNTPDDLDTTERAHTLDLLPAGILEFRIAANEEEAKSFSEDGTDLGWYDSVMDNTDNLVAREQGRRTQVLLWQTPDKSMTASDDNESKWRVIQVSVIAEPDKPGRIGVVFDEEGGRQLKKLTAENTMRRLAMLVDGRVVSCPTIRSTIGPRVEITGDFSKAELNRLATALQAGMEPSRPQTLSPSPATR